MGKFAIYVASNCDYEVTGAAWVTEKYTHSITGHRSYVTFESVKKELNRAMNNDQITSSALFGACVKSNESRRVECQQICAMQMFLTESHSRQ